MDDDQTTQELELEVLRRELGERQAAEDTADSEERRVHSRRADRASYLRDRLAERAESERRLEEE
jgi:hypothetical protein